MTFSKSSGLRLSLSLSEYFKLKFEKKNLQISMPQCPQINTAKSYVKLQESNLGPQIFSSAILYNSFLIHLGEYADFAACSGN